MADNRLIYDVNGLHEAGINFTPRHLARLVANLQFPRPFKLNGGTRAWWASDIKEWLQCQAEGRPYHYAPKPRPAPRRKLVEG